MILYQDKINRVLIVIDEIYLMIIHRDVDYLVQEINKLRVGFLEILFLDNLYKEDAAKEDKKVFTIIGKESIRCDKLESFQDEKLFRINYMGVFLK